VLSTTDGKVLARIPVGDGPHGLCVWPQPGRYSIGVSDFSNELISISTASGNGTFVAGVQFNDVFDIASRPSDGVMFATDSATNRLYQLDTSNGNMIEVGQEIGGVQGNLVGLAFGPIPAPGTAAILALGGIAATKRRRTRG